MVVDSPKKVHVPNVAPFERRASAGENPVKKSVA
jgi:hypothetical protein